MGNKNQTPELILNPLSKEFYMPGNLSLGLLTVTFTEVENLLWTMLINFLESERNFVSELTVND